MADISEPRCGKCRWQKKAAIEGYAGRPMEIGIRVARGPFDGVEIKGQHFIALGGHYCEHPKQPRGLVLTNYACPNFERAPVVDDQSAGLPLDGIEHNGFPEVNHG